MHIKKNEKVKEKEKLTPTQGNETTVKHGQFDGVRNGHERDG